MNSGQARPALFALEGSREFAGRVASHLGWSLAALEERPFEDGEHKSRPLESVRGRDVFVIHSLYGEPQRGVNDKLIRLLFFSGALKDVGAASLTLVIPYLCYARKDRKTQPRDPVTTRYLAQLIESVGVDRVVTLDVHNLAAYQNAFRCAAEHLEAAPLIADHFAAQLRQPVVLSPDIGGEKRAARLAQLLARRLGQNVGLAVMEKKRALGVVSGKAFYGEVGGKEVVILDDLISTGTTLRRAVEACAERGAGRVFAAATHGLFVGEAATVLDHPLLEKLIITDTVPPFRLPAAMVEKKVVVLDTVRLFAQAIEALASGGSLTALRETVG